MKISDSPSVQGVAHRKLRFFLTRPSPCPYLEGQSERRIFTNLAVSEADAIHDALTHSGFRRSREVAYRPACATCSACRSTRVLVNRFDPGKRWRRVLTRNKDLVRRPVKPVVTREQFALFKAYLTARHLEGGMRDMTTDDFATMAERSPVQSVICEYREGREEDAPLVAAVIRTCSSDGLSMVYSFFDPACPDGGSAIISFSIRSRRPVNWSGLRVSRILGARQPENGDTSKPFVRWKFSTAIHGATSRLSNRVLVLRGRYEQTETHSRGGLAAGAGALAACGQAGTGTAPGSPAISRKRRQLSMVTTWPKGLPGSGKAAERVAERIEAATDGLITVKVFAAGELVPAFGAFDAVSTGTADMYHGAEYYWQSKSKAFNFFTAVPMGMTAQELMGWIDFGGGQALWEELSGQFGIIAFQAANTGHQMGGWFKREINTLDDFNGLKMRIPGLGGDVIRGLGGAAVALAGGEIYQALQTGTIDATEWVGPWNDFSLGFYREAKNYYGPGFHEPGSGLAVGMNRRVWDSLTASDQVLIRSICSDVNALSLGEFTYFNAIYLETLIKDHGVQMRRFSPEIMSRVSSISRDVRSDAGSGDDLSKRIYESFETALKSMRGWASVSEGPYYSSRDLETNG